MPTLFHRRRLLAALAATFACPSLPAWAGPRPLMQANLYRPGVPLADYLVSEKYDGVRAYWDGRSLYTRQGHRIPAPGWFTAGWPLQALDGELWAGPDRFKAVSSAVARDVPDDEAWRALRYMAFDLPAMEAPFDRRLAALAALLPSAVSHLQVVPHRHLSDEAALMTWLRDTVRAGGEGLMLRRADSFYRADRSDDLLKLKQHQDAEAVVIAHHAGQGRLRGRLGALLVETPDGKRFRLGSGFSDAERDAPPPLGSVVTYRHAGWHAGGLPRFATYLRIRPD